MAAPTFSGRRPPARKIGTEARLADLPAHAPVVAASRAPELLHGEGLVPRVEQECVDRGGHGHRLLDRFRAGDVHDLDEADPGQQRAQVGVRAAGEAIADLDRGGAEAALLGRDLRRTLEARQQER